MVKREVLQHNDTLDVFLILRNIVQSYEQAGETLEILRGINLEVKRGEMVGLVGPSGAGKSTLLHIAGLLERPVSGSIIIGGKDTSKASDRERTAIRRRNIGFVYQFHHLLPEFSALENVMLPQILEGKGRGEASEVAAKLLQQVGLSARMEHRPAKLSGGEQQRVAIARALANSPQMLIADEPTGNLDHHTSLEVFNLLTNLVRDRGLGALIATHNMELAARMDRVVEIQDGKLSEMGTSW